ncbi:MAG: hypothetical protein HYS13_01470 [Planctomycetia bacterium]|nr:hypothetical protein [Planctomycetia bacterium]
MTADTPVPFDPYRNWLGIASHEQPANHYRLLAIKVFEDDPQAIARAADERMAHVKTFQTGRHSELSQQVLNELAAARVCLLDPERKAAYDAALQERLMRDRAAPGGAIEAMLPPEVPRATLAQTLLAPLRRMALRGPSWSRLLRRWWGPVVAVLVAICVMLAIVALAKKFAPPESPPAKTSGTP